MPLIHLPFRCSCGSRATGIICSSKYVGRPAWNRDGELVARGHRVQAAYERERAEWRGLVGTLMLRFGDIEYFTVRCLVHLGKGKSARDDKFAKRTDRLIKVIRDRYGTSPPAAELVQKLEEAKSLAKVRNDIAHNPLQMRIYLDEAADDVLVEPVIIAIRTGKAIDLASLKESTARIDDLASELFLAFVRLQSDAKRER